MIFLWTMTLVIEWFVNDMMMHSTTKDWSYKIADIKVSYYTSLLLDIKVVPPMTIYPCFVPARLQKWTSSKCNLFGYIPYDETCIFDFKSFTKHEYLCLWLIFLIIDGASVITLSYMFAQSTRDARNGTALIFFKYRSPIKIIANKLPNQPIITIIMVNYLCFILYIVLTFP